MADQTIRSKWNDGSGLHVSRLFGLVQPHEQGISLWITLPLLWRVGVRFARRDYVIDRTKHVHLWRMNSSLYIPVNGGRWVRTTIRGVAERLAELGYQIERSRPSTS
jgi:hypothetical protein